jgi:hypothetical protein
LSDRLVAFLTGKHPWVCRRCGWKGRAAWREEDVVRLPEGRYDTGQADADLLTLDDSSRSADTHDQNSFDGDPSSGRSKTKS